MPFYRFVCSKQHVIEEFFRMADKPDWIKCDCGDRAVASFPTRFTAQTFKPYVEANLTSSPVEITSKTQRDKLCKKHGVTYDSNRYHTKKPYRAAVEDLDFAEVKRVAERGRLDDGTPIQGTVSETIE